jgi:hypothetical protein
LRAETAERPAGLEFAAATGGRLATLAGVIDAAGPAAKIRQCRRMERSSKGISVIAATGQSYRHTGLTEGDVKRFISFALVFPPG